MKSEQSSDPKASSEFAMVSSANTDLDYRGRRQFGRRSFLKGIGMVSRVRLPNTVKSEGCLVRQSGLNLRTHARGNFC
jgi:hypothetical protein